MTGTIDPALFGMPDATTTGVQAGVTLTPYTGPMNITTSGTVIENMIIDGQLNVYAANVTIRNCIIRSDGWWGIEGENASNLRVENCDIIGGSLTNSGILGAGTFVGNDISHVSIGIQLTDGASTVRGNYVHDLFYGNGDPHYDGMTLLGGQNHVVIEHNTFSVPSSGGTASILISDTFGPVNDVRINNNLMLGDPSYTVYFTNSTNIVFTNNYVERGYYGYYVYENSNPTMSGNVQWNNNTDPTPYPTSAPTLPSTPTQPSTPSVPTIASFSNDTGKAGDGITSDNTLQLKGTAAAGSTVKIYDGSTQIGSMTASPTGSWDYITSVLSNAKHVLTATATSSGQTSAASGAVTVTVDTVAPTAPALSSNSIVNSNQVKLSGTAEANSNVTVYDGTTAVGTATTNSTGAWSITTNALSTGTHALTVKAADVAGNVSAASQSISSVISGASPTPPAPTPTTIESNGSTSLVQSGKNYVLNSASGGTGPVLKMQGAAVVVDQFGPWKPIGAEKTATGYQVAWKDASTGLYTAWNTDNNGNYISNVSGLTGYVSGTNSALKSLETSLHQDLNGDGQIGLVTTAVETQGSTDLTHAGDRYLLRDSAGSGPSLKFGGADFVDGQFGGWAPIGAEKTATGYQVAWKDAGTGQYTAWNTDNNGNYVSNVTGLTGYVAGTNSALKSFETNLQQDLNGDGQIGLVTTAVETQGATDLAHAGDRYLLRDSAGSGPSLKFGGADFVDGQFGGWAPIGAEKTATGYQVAWKDASTGLYTAWNTDNNGNYVSNVSGLTGHVAGTNSALKSFETNLQQDLNGDGQIGASSAGAPLSSVALTTMYKNWSDGVTIKGVADANSQIKLYDGNTSLGTVTTAADGTWSFKTSSAVSDAVHTYTAKQIDSTGQVVGTSGSAILGSTGSNTLTGTTGNDIFVGSGQGDTFVFAANFGRDVIKDFLASGSGQDTIQFSKTVFDSFASVLSHASQVGEDVAISTGNDTLTLKNTKLGALTSNDFHFA